MKISFVVYYTDGTSSVVDFDSPPRAHPSSSLAYLAGLCEAERLGKTVDRLGSAKVNPFSGPPGPIVIDENLMDREGVIRAFRESFFPNEDLKTPEALLRAATRRS